jgi:hypothetical protein
MDSQKNVLEKMFWRKCFGENVLEKMFWRKCFGENVFLRIHKIDLYSTLFMKAYKKYPI